MHAHSKGENCFKSGFLFRITSGAVICFAVCVEFSLSLCKFFLWVSLCLFLLSFFILVCSSFCCCCFVCFFFPFLSLCLSFFLFLFSFFFLSFSSIIFFFFPVFLSFFPFVGFSFFLTFCLSVCQRRLRRRQKILFRLFYYFIF